MQDLKNRKAMIARICIAMKDAKKRDIAIALKLTPQEFSSMLHNNLPIDDVTFKTLLDILKVPEEQIEKLLLSTGLQKERTMEEDLLDE